MLTKTIIFIKKNWHIILFFIVAIVWFISFYNRLPDEDEAVIAGHSYFFDKLGYVKSDLYGGYGYNWEVKQYFYHKLFVLSGSLAMNLFGYNIYVFKSISLLFTLLLFFFIYRYVKEFLDNNKKIFVFSITLLLWNSIFFDHSFVYRPEIMVVAFGFISFFYLKKGMQTNKVYYFIFSGISAGLSVFAHLNGLIFCSAGAILLLLNKNFKNSLKNSFVFSFFAGLTILLYFFDIHSITDFNNLYTQLTTDPNVLDKKSPFIMLLNEQMRFFWSIEEASFSVCFFFIVFFAFKNVFKQNKDLLLYLMLLIISLGLLAHGKTTKYAINYYPFMTIIIAFFIIKKLRESSKFVQKSIIVLLFVFFVVQGVFNIKLINSQINIAERTKYISSLIPEKNIKISAPSVFVFNEIYNYTIRGTIAFDHHYMAFKPNQKKTIDKYFNFAEDNGDKYIVIDKKLNTKDFIIDSEIFSLGINDIFENYKLMKKEDDILIFSHID